MSKIIFYLLILFAPFFTASAESYHRATILEVVPVGGDNAQMLTVRVPSLATTTTILNDRSPLTVGKEVYVKYDTDSQNVFTLFEIRKINTLLLLLAIFIFFVLLVNGKKGLRSLIGLALTICIALFVLIPLIAKGYPVLITTVLVSTLILACALYVTHGFKRDTHIAFISSGLAVVCATVLAGVIFPLFSMSAMPVEELTYLQVLGVPLETLVNFIIAGIIIGTLGVVDDVAITQVATVAALRSANSQLSLQELFVRAFKVGQEHTAALVNTLALAYIGASLPLVVLLSSASYGGIIALQQEPVIIEIFRIVIGSIGVLLVVPIATLCAVFYALPADKDKDGDSHGHHHG